MSNIMTRAISGAVFVALLVFCILFSKETLLGLFFILTLLGLHEFYTIHGVKKTKWIPIIMGGIFYILSSPYIENGVLFDIVVLSIFMVILMIIELFNKKGSFVDAGLKFMGIMYIAVPFTMLSYAAHYFNRLSIVVLGLFIMIWANDTGAYLTGRAFGKHKLFERISPNKTIEGLIGGGILAVIAGIVLSIFYDNLERTTWIIMALIVFIFANLGDLIESMMKRNLGIKDSGSIMPGHGGILDRFDGVLLAVPVVFWYVLQTLKI